MKKLMTILLAVTLLCAATAFADELPAETDSFRFETFGDAVATMEEGDSFAILDGYTVAVIMRDGRCIRVVAPLDDHAKELYAAYLEDGDYTIDKFTALSEYSRTLPVQYSEELAVVPYTQEELDAMAGKTIEEVMSEPWGLGMRNYPENAEAGEEIVFPMVKGFQASGNRPGIRMPASRDC